MMTDVKENAKENVKADVNVKAEIKVTDLEFKKWIMAYQFKVYKKGIKKKVLPGAIMRLWSTWWTQDFPFTEDGLRLKVGSGGNIMNCTKSLTRRLALLFDTFSLIPLFFSKIFKKE